MGKIFVVKKLLSFTLLSSCTSTSSSCQVKTMKINPAFYWFVLFLTVVQSASIPTSVQTVAKAAKIVSKSVKPQKFYDVVNANIISAAMLSSAAAFNKYSSATFYRPKRKSSAFFIERKYNQEIFLSQSVIYHHHCMEDDISSSAFLI